MIKPTNPIQPTKKVSEKHSHVYTPMIEENWQLFRNEPVEFEKQPFEAQDLKNITNHFRVIYRICPKLIKETKGCQHVNGWTCKH